MAETSQNALSRSKRPAKGLVANIGQIFVYYDGPQVLTLIDQNKRTWIASALPSADGRHYPVFCVQVLAPVLRRYLRGHVDLRYLFRYRPQSDYRIADLAPNSDRAITLEAVTPDLDWFPEEGFFVTDHNELVPVESRSDKPGMTVNIDGKWEFSEFAAFGGRMPDCYSFLYAMNAVESLDLGGRSNGSATLSSYTKVVEYDGPIIDLPIEDYPWKRGGSARSFYQAAYSRVPANDRLNVERIEYASPGSIELSGNQDIISKIKSNLKSMAANFLKAQEEYGNLHSYLSRQKLLGVPADDLRGDARTQEIVGGRVRRLAELITFEGVEELYTDSKDNWVRAAKILMSYYRRLRDLFQFFAEGRAPL